MANKKTNKVKGRIAYNLYRIEYNCSCSAMGGFQSEYKTGNMVLYCHACNSLIDVTWE